MSNLALGTRLNSTSFPGSIRVRSPPRPQGQPSGAYPADGPGDEVARFSSLASRNMPSNVEVKAKVRDFEKLKSKAKELSQSEGTIIEQADTFYNVPQGRLKLRCLQDQPSQLIYYERADQSGPKLSDYFTACTSTPKDLDGVLSRSLGIKGVVKKRRTLFLVGQTRVHCDEVEGLGQFMELEVVLGEGQTAEEGQAIAHDLMKKLDVQEEDLITCAYMDLINAKGS